MWKDTEWRQGYENISKEKFLDLALLILGNRTVYQDDVVIISREYSGLDLCVTFTNKAPVLMVKDGKIILFSVKTEEMVEHMQEVAFNTTHILD